MSFLSKKRGLGEDWENILPVEILDVSIRQKGFHIWPRPKTRDETMSL